MVKNLTRSGRTIICPLSTPVGAPLATRPSTGAVTFASSEKEGDYIGALVPILRKWGNLAPGPGLIDLGQRRHSPPRGRKYLDEARFAARSGEAHANLAQRRRWPLSGPWMKAMIGRLRRPKQVPASITKILFLCGASQPATDAADDLMNLWDDSRTSKAR